MMEEFFVMDCFKEDVVVSRNNLLGNILYVLCWVFPLGRMPTR